MKDERDEIKKLAAAGPDDDPGPGPSAAEDDDPFSLDPLSPLP